MGNLNNAGGGTGWTKYTQMVRVAVTQSSGAAGWITDVDLSGSLSAAWAGRYAHVVMKTNSGGSQNTGIRDVDSSSDVKINMLTASVFMPVIVKISSSRTVDLYREAADNYFYFDGYFE